MAKILISAYACEPNKGSEPEVGWQWVINIAKKHEVWVLTKENNRDTIEKFKKNYSNDIPWDNMHFLFVHLPQWLVFWKKGNRGMRLYYYLWAKKAFQIAKDVHKKEKFDLVHSITFVSLTQPCFLYKLNIPFVWNVAGGENINNIIKYEMTLKERLYEFIRSLGQLQVRYSLRINKALKKAAIVLATTEETANLIPENFRDKVIITASIGIDKKRPIKLVNQSDEIRILLSGKFTYLKGVRIGIDAILKVIDSFENVQVTILGNGPYESEYKNKCKNYIGKKIHFVDKIPHEKMVDFYQQHDFLINTALRDSGCLVAMEAMSIGLPIVCINTGGVRAMTNDEIAIRVEPQKYEDLVDEMAKGIQYLLTNKKVRETLGKKAYEYINQEYLYEHKCEWLLHQYEEILKDY